ncbi:MAG: hypothetical protein ACLQBU_14405 [Terriglobales bacterium]
MTKGKVSKITPTGADVQIGVEYTDGTYDADNKPIHFDKDGCSYLTKSELSVTDWQRRINGTYECGPWHLTDPALMNPQLILEFEKERKWPPPTKSQLARFANRPKEQIGQFRRKAERARR